MAAFPTASLLLIVTTRYWMLICNPRKWAIDRFLEEGKTYDTWGVRPSDARQMAPGDLCVLRVGIDRRPRRELHGRPRLQSGIHALCVIESAAYESYGASRELWADEHAPKAPRPTVLIRYACTYPVTPLTIERLREARSDVSRHLLDGFQGSSVGLSPEDFDAVAQLLGESEASLQSGSAGLPSGSENAVSNERHSPSLTPPPRVIERVVREIERGPGGEEAKHLTGHRCQLCEALGLDPVGFKSRASGKPYVEAHHVVPVSRLEAGTLGVDNIMTLCATHHRQIHHGEGVEVQVEADVFVVAVPEGTVRIKRLEDGRGP